MGASGWSYFTPYQPDAEAALQALRRDIFERKAYGLGQSIQPEIFAAMTPELKKAFEQLRQAGSLSLGGEGASFDSIEELLEAAAENGTHSILDIISISPVPDFAVAWAADEAMIAEVYGSAQPTHEAVESKAGELTEVVGLERWQAVFVTVYQAGQPSELYFEGISGD